MECEDCKYYDEYCLIGRGRCPYNKEGGNGIPPKPKGSGILPKDI